MATISLDVNPKKYVNMPKIRFATRALLVAALLTALVLFSLNQLQGLLSQRTGSNELYTANAYHIVFMDNNLFYFCQLQDFNNEFVKCNNPYYLVRRKPAGEKEERIFVTTPKDEEVYQPEGPIYLNKRGIIYISAVGKKSEVLKYIQSQK